MTPEPVMGYDHRDPWDEPEPDETERDLPHEPPPGWARPHEHE